MVLLYLCSANIHASVHLCSITANDTSTFHATAAPSLLQLMRYSHAECSLATGSLATNYGHSRQRPLLTQLSRQQVITIATSATTASVEATESMPVSVGGVVLVS